MHIYVCIEENNVYEYMNKCSKESLAFRISCIREESQNSEGRITTVAYLPTSPKALLHNVYPPGISFTVYWGGE